MADYEHWQISVASESAPENSLYVAIVVGNPLTGDWALGQMVDPDNLPDLIGELNASAAVALLSQVEATIGSKSATNPDVPAAELFGDQWIANLLRQSGEIFQLSQLVAISGLNAEQVLEKAITLTEERFSNAEHSHHCEDHTHSNMPPSMHKLSDTIGDYPLEESDGTSVKEILHEVVAISFSLGDLVDNVLKAIVNPAIDRLHAETERKAMMDPTYAEIEKRRRPEGQNPYSSIMFSEEHDLGHEELELQRRVRQSVAREPWWESLAYKIARDPISSTMHRVERIIQRITRGWDDSDVWSLDTVLTKRLGEQLLALSHDGHSWPGSGENGEGEYQTSEDWDIALHVHGTVLVDYALHKFDFGPELDGTHGPLEELYEAAQHSLIWVAMNLGDLWD